MKTEVNINALKLIMLEKPSYYDLYLNKIEIKFCFYILTRAYISACMHKLP